MNRSDLTKTVLVAGAGLSGQNAAALLLRNGYSVLLYDGNAELNLTVFLTGLGESAGRLQLQLGAFPLQLPDVCCCVVSPGIPLTKDFIQRLKAAGIPVISEVQLAFWFARGRLAAITGTNGKTTTTALTGHILSGWKEEVHVVGNIGHAYTAEADKMTDGAYSALELSSFQLETLEGFVPDVSAILNITPDHLDRHGTLENYADVKKKICASQTPDDVCVLNAEDPLLADVPGRTAAKILYFSSKSEPEEGAFLRDGRIVVRLNGRESSPCACSELQILGRHNYENAMAAILITSALGVPEEIIRAQLLSFKAVEHRIEYVEKKRGVVYYNDSKGTNPDAAIQAVRAMNWPTYLIAGGYDKHSEYGEWLSSFEGKVKLLILLGATADKIEAECRALSAAPVLRVSSLEEAVAEAAKRALPGDAVLLSPACASWDMFPNYEERGRIFKELVRALPDGE